VRDDRTFLFTMDFMDFVAASKRRKETSKRHATIAELAVSIRSSLETRERHLEFASRDEASEDETHQEAASLSNREANGPPTHTSEISTMHLSCRSYRCAQQRDP